MATENEPLVVEGDEQRRAILRGWLRDHGALISKVVRSWASSTHDGEDLLQEIALQLWESIPRWEGRSALSTWIYRVALYAAMAWSRRERGHRDRASTLEVEAALASEARTDADDPRVEWLYAEIGRLGNVDRSIALLLLDGWSYRGMADALGITEKNVSVRIHRIKKALVERSNESELV